MKLTARIFGFLFAFFLLLFISKTSFARATLDIQQYQAPNINSDVPKNLHFWTQNVMIEVMSSMICQLSGIDPVNPNQECLGVDRQSGKIGFVKNGGGAIGVTGSLIAGTFLIPVHFRDYATYAVNNFGFPKKSYAQTGIGYTGLQPVVGLFTTFRNIAYLLMVFVFIIIGVAIMLRARIDPRTVMTIQNQIPKLVIGLIMITFSYAIVGLLIDVMWVSTYFVINTLAPADPTQRQLVTESITLSPPGFVQNVFTNNDGIAGLATNAAGSVSKLVADVFHSGTVQNSFDTSSNQGGCGLNVFCAIGDFISGTLGDMLSNILAFFLGWFAGIIAFFVFLIAIIVALFKLWFALLKSFITILLDTILAPFWILGGLLPGAGQSIGLGPWLRDVTANLAVFPAVIFLFLVAKVTLEGFRSANVTCTSGSTTCLIFNPPLIGNNATADNAQMLGALIAVGFILAAPGVVESVKKAFKASSGVGLGGTAVGAAAVGAVGGAIGSRLYRKDPRTGEIRGAVGTRIQKTFGETAQSNPYTGRFAKVRNAGRATLRTTLGVEKTNELGTTLNDRQTKAKTDQEAKDAKAREIRDNILKK